MDHRRIKVILAERAITQWQLAKRLRMNAATLSDYLRGARAAPGDLGARIEAALRLPTGTLNPK